MAKIPYHKIEKFSGKRAILVKGVPVVKRCNYVIVQGVSVTGDAPKVIVRIHDRKEGRHYFKRNKHRWSIYIAKTGHKWYPVESLTEYLLNLLGKDFGLNMAESSVAMIGGQLRFLSKYFLSSQWEELVHGADIFAGFLGDRELVEQIEEQALSRDLFTLQFVENAVEYLFPFQKDEIMNSLVRLLLYDAWVGNNDRHFYNWGIVRSIRQSFTPYFSPVYTIRHGDCSGMMTRTKLPVERAMHRKRSGISGNIANFPVLSSVGKEKKTSIISNWLKKYIITSSIFLNPR